MSTGIIFAGLGAALSINGALEAADAADRSIQGIKEAKEQREKQAKFNLAKTKIALAIQARANEIHNVWVDYYLPCEVNTLNEICAEPEVVANEALVAQRAIAEAAKIFSAKRRKAVYCLAPQQVGQRAEVEFVLSTEQADLATGLVRAQIEAERGRVRLVNQQSMENRKNIINAGRGHTVNVASGLNALSDLYSGLIKDSQSAIDNAARTQGRALASLIDTGQEFLKPNNPIRALLRGQDGVGKEFNSYTTVNFRETPTINIVGPPTEAQDLASRTPLFREDTDYSETNQGRDN